MGRRKRLWSPVATLVAWLVLARATSAWSEGSPYDRLLMLESGRATETQSLMVVEIGFDGFQIRKIADVPSRTTIVSVVPGTVVLFDPLDFCFVDAGASRVSYARLEIASTPIDGDVAAGRAFVLMPGPMLRVVDLATRSWRDVGLDPGIDTGVPSTLSRFTPSPDGRHVAFCVQQTEVSGNIASMKSQYDVYVCNGETGATVVTAEVRWPPISTSSNMGRGPDILWLDERTALTFNRREDQPVLELVRLDAGTGSVRAGPGLEDEHPQVTDPRPSLIPGTLRVTIDGVGAAVVFDPRADTFPERMKDRGLHVEYVNEGRELLDGEELVESGTPLRPIERPSISPDGKRAVWIVRPLEKGEDGAYRQSLKGELWYYQVGDDENRLVGTVATNNSQDFVWAKSSDMQAAAPPAKPAEGWQPLTLSPTPR